MMSIKFVTFHPPRNVQAATHGAKATCEKHAKLSKPRLKSSFLAIRLNKLLCCCLKGSRCRVHVGLAQRRGWLLAVPGAKRGKGGEWPGGGACCLAPLPASLPVDGRTDGRASHLAPVHISPLALLRPCPSFRGPTRVPCPALHQLSLPCSFSGTSSLQNKLKKDPAESPKQGKGRGKGCRQNRAGIFLLWLLKLLSSLCFFLFPFHSSSCGEFLITTGLPRS
jgi:hypothetical protein